MFRREVKPLDNLLGEFLKYSGLETPLLQHRLVNAWDEVMGPLVSRYTRKKYISNQTLIVIIDNSALRAELSMMRSQVVEKLNSHVGARVIVDVKFR